MYVLPPKNRPTKRTWVVLGLSLSLFTSANVAFPDPSPIADDEGRPRISWEEAGQIVDRDAFVFGKVISVTSTKSNHFLNFDSNKPAKFVGVVRDEFVSHFSAPLKDMYEGKLVQIRGFVSTYQGRPQIYVRDPSQVKILDALPQTKPLPPVKGFISQETITVATFNVLNLFDDVDDPYVGDETTKAKPREELERLADTLRKMDADVVGLQEVENRGILRRFLETFLPDMGYRYVELMEANDVRGIDVALISRVPLGIVRSHRHVAFSLSEGSKTNFERDLLSVEILPHGAPSFEMWVVHLKSNFEGREYAEPIRRAEAAYIRQVLDERLSKQPEARILLCGDFNDVWDSPTLKTIVGTGVSAMRSLFQGIPEDKRITYNQPPYLTMIDFVLASPAMAERFVEGSYNIVHGSPDTTGSDHNAVLARFRIAKVKDGGADSSSKGE